jgi:CRP-like cAMP-binding protein
VSRFHINYNNQQEKISVLSERIRRKELQIPFGINEALDGKKLGTIKFWVFKEVVAMGEGKSFGELALMTSKPRAATI